MSEGKFFFDTYAFFEILRGNPKYAIYKQARAVTTIFNLAELNYNLKKYVQKRKADKITEEYRSYLIEVTVDDIKEATDLKIKNKQLSLPDVIGYTIAKRLKVKFLTGDEGFRNFENVEFVKG